MQTACMVAACQFDTDWAQLNGQEGSSWRAHSTISQQARGGGATEQGSLWLPETPPHSFPPSSTK